MKNLLYDATTTPYDSDGNPIAAAEETEYLTQDMLHERAMEALYHGYSRSIELVGSTLVITTRDEHGTCYNELTAVLVNV